MFNYAIIASLEIGSYEEALATFRKTSDQEGIASIYLNIGAALYCAGRFTEAIERYQESLNLFAELELPRGQAQAYYNLAEACAALGQIEQAQRHWREGYALSQSNGLDDQLQEFRDLRDRTPALHGLDTAARVPVIKTAGNLLPEERTALDIARREGRVTTKKLTEQAHIAESTAKRVLAGLVERGLLVRIGQGRATGYVLPA
jgi:tetratricopeptide (TPR) repeat protein